VALNSKVAVLAPARILGPLLMLLCRHGQLPMPLLLPTPPQPLSWTLLPTMLLPPAAAVPDWKAWYALRDVQRSTADSPGCIRKPSSWLLVTPCTHVRAQAGRREPQ
jgi:hypothetical protein